MGYLTDYPLCWKERTISSVEEIGVQRPSTYDTFLHANCTGCLKAGKMHWYATYCLRPDIYEEAVLAEEVIGYSILKNVYLKELKEEFEDLKRKNIQPTDCSCCGSSFFANARRTVSGQLSLMDCFHLV